MNKKITREALHQMAEKAVIRDEQNSRITFVATNPTGNVLECLNTTLTGLDEESVVTSRSINGSNHVTKEKKKSLRSAWPEPLSTHSQQSSFAWPSFPQSRT